MTRPPLLTQQQAATHLNVTARTVRQWTSDGRLGCIRPTDGDRTVRYRQEDIDAFEAANYVPATR